MGVIKNTIKKSLRFFLQFSSTCFNFIIAPKKLKNTDLAIRIIIDLPEKFSRKLPISINELNYNFFDYAKGTTEYSAETFYELHNNVKVVAPDGAVINRNNELLTYLSPQIGTPLNSHSLLKEYKLAKPIFLYGLSLLATGSQASNNYFHWMTDAFPRIAIAKKANFLIDKFNHIIVNNYSYNFQKEALEIIGVLSNKIISLTVKEHVVCEKIFTPSPTCLSGNVSPWIVNFLRESFSTWMLVDQSSPTKIYVTRKNAIKRRIINEIEVINFLENQGYSVVELENLSLKQQVILFSNVKSIVAPHGAGLTNIIFCNKGTNLLELFPDTYVNQCYWTIASINEMKYGYLLGQTRRTELDKNEFLVDSDFNINLKEFYDIQQFFTENSK